MGLWSSPSSISWKGSRSGRRIRELGVSRVITHTRSRWLADVREQRNQGQVRRVLHGGVALVFVGELSNARKRLDRQQANGMPDAAAMYSLAMPAVENNGMVAGPST